MNAHAIDTVPAMESAQSRLFSAPAAIGFYFAARLCISYLFFQESPKQGAIAEFGLNIAFLLAASFYSFGPLPSKLQSPPRTRCFSWVLAFLAFSLLSLAWSETVSLTIAFAYWLGMAADVLMVIVLLRTGKTMAVSSQVLQGFVYGACFIALVMWLSPTMQDLRPGNDDFFSPNAIGFTCAFGAFFAQLLSTRQPGWKLPAAFLALSLLRSLSKTTILAFIAGELVVLTRDKTISRRNKLMMVAAALLVIAAFWNLLTAYYDIYINAGNQSETLTGRIGIWAFVLERSWERPWLGHGFHSFRNVIPPFGTFEAWHAHNEVIQQFYAYGVAGIVLLAGAYGSFWWQVRRVLQPSQRTLLLGLLLFILVRGLGDTERFDLSFPLWSIALLSLMFAQADGSREASL